MILKGVAGPGLSGMRLDEWAVVDGDDRYGGLPAARLMLHCRRMASRAKDGGTVEAEAPAGEDFVKDCQERGIAVPVL